MQFNFEKSLRKVYFERFMKYGAKPQGSFWASKLRQDKRFDIILSEINKIEKSKNFELSDIGCGYGALVNYIRSSGVSSNVRYSGYDISQGLINHCKSKYLEDWANFSVGTYPREITPYCVMSGTYNLSATLDIIEWERYVLSSILRCWEQTSRAMIFNLQIAKNSQITEEMIFYAERDSILNFCLSSLGPTKLVTHKNLPKDVTFVVIR